MLSILFDTSFWYDLILIAAIVLIVIACIKWPNGKWFVGTVLTVAMVVLTGYCVTQLNYYYNAQGGIFGTITGIFDTNVIEVNEMTISLKNVELVQEHDDVYSAKVLSNEVMALAENEKFAVYINGEPCSTSTNESDYVVAEYNYSFLGQEFNELCYDTLTFRIAFYSNSTYLSVSTSGGADAVKYWNYYFNKNKFEMKIDKAQYVYGEDINYGEGDISNYYKVVSYYLNNELYTSQIYIVNTPLTLLDKPGVESRLTFIGWYDGNDENIDSGYIVTDNISIYGYTVNAIPYSIYTNELNIGNLQSYNGDQTEVVIPTSYSVFKGIAIVGGDHAVTGLNYTFANNEQIEAVTIPSTITNVHKAFSNCTNLKTIYVDSEYIYNDLTLEANESELIDQVENIYILKTIDTGSNQYLNTQYDKTTVEIGGKVYNHYTPSEDAEYTVKFLNYFDYVVETRVVQRGQAISIFPEVPQQVTVTNVTIHKDEIYKFSCWADEQGNIVTEETQITKNTTIQAVYIKTGGTGGNIEM